MYRKVEISLIEFPLSLHGIITAHEIISFVAQAGQQQEQTKPVCHAVVLLNY
ncbi:MAG: hypothetical protein ACI8RD_007440 [Bacillariaceae sp.]|jgi:hypothetical protein